MFLPKRKTALAVSDNTIQKLTFVIGLIMHWLAFLLSHTVAKTQTMPQAIFDAKECCIMKNISNFPKAFYFVGVCDGC